MTSTTPTAAIPTPAECAELRALAERATAGPWEQEQWASPRWRVYAGKDKHDIPVFVAETGFQTNAPNNAAFIAAANPQRIIELLDELAGARGALSIIAAIPLAGRRVATKLHQARALARAHLGGQAPPLDPGVRR